YQRHNAVTRLYKQLHLVSSIPVAPPLLRLFAGHTRRGELMRGIHKGLPFSIALVALTVATADEPAGSKIDKPEVVEITGQGPAVLWRYPQDIASRNLYYGPGGKEHAPRDGFFTFDKEDMGGTNPKFDAVDEVEIGRASCRERG